MELARQKQSAAQVSDQSDQLREYGGVRSQFGRAHVFDLLTKGLLPLGVILYIVMNVFGCGPKNVGAVSVTPTVRVVATPTVIQLGLGMFGTSDYGFPTVTSSRGQGQVVQPTLDVRVRCYAVRDASSVYSTTQVLENGLFMVEKYTRVQGGMIFNSRFGWYRVSDFGCQPGLERLEVEFVGPTRTLTPRPVVKATSTSLPVSPVPSPTLRSGIISFSADGCRLSWLVWDVQSVYLVYGGKREPVAGDRSGRSVSYDLVPCVAGVVRLEALRGGETYIREIMVQGGVK